MMQDDLHYHIIPPPADLTDIVFGILRIIPKQSLPLRIVADGRPGIIFTVNRSPDGSWEQKSLIYGQTTTYDDLYVSGDSILTGIVFHPYVIKSLFGFDADEIKDQALPLKKISPGQKLPAVISTPGDQFDAILIYLRKLKNQIRPLDAVIRESITRIRQSGGTVKLPSLHKHFRLSERQFERRFKQHTGIPPVLFSRITRFQSVLKQVRSQSYHKLSDIAFDAGYADQAHFSREFKEFSGFTPGQYHSPDREIMEICRL